MSALELRQAAESLREREIHTDLADILDRAADGFDSVGFPEPQHESAFPIITVARAINGGAA